MVFFVKYDFWFNFMQAIHDQHVPLYYISVIFRQDQHFFRWYGQWARMQLKNVTRFFVQDEISMKLLKSIGFNNVLVTGDTRFDRVYAIARDAQPIPLISRFCGNRKVMVAGSCWEPDEAVFMPVVNSNELKMKFILAPHDTRPERIKYIREALQTPSVLYSELNEENAGKCDVLIIDSVGILNKLYQYATVAFIGGGFGSGLHNIQEPVTFGVPVFFGPSFSKFREARDLVDLGGVFTIQNTQEFRTGLFRIVSDEQELQRVSAICKNYVEMNRGATGKILGVMKAM